MDEIFKRCSPLKRTSFINNYVSLTNQDIVKGNGHQDENLEETQHIECHEVKLFSPHRAPEPITLNARLDTMSNCYRASNSSPQVEVKMRSPIKTQANNDYSDQVNLDYKLQILD